MATPQTRQKINRSIGAADEPSPLWQLLTQVAFVLALALVIARMTMQEFVREPFEQVMPGTPAVPRGAGATTGLVLDLLCFLPALMVMARRALDRSYTLRWTWSHLPIGLLGLWALLSTFWATDQFLALVNAVHLLAAVSLLWAASQFVRSWLRTRLVAAVCFGLLLILITQGWYYRWIDLPALQEGWERDRVQILQERGWEEGSFQAQMFEKKILGGEMLGFYASPNTYAAVLVLLSVGSAGVAIQRWRSRDEPGWAAILAIGIVLALHLIYLTHSRTAIATPILAAGLFGLIAWKRDWLNRRPRLLYWAGVTTACTVVLGVIVYGLTQGELFHVSLTFRWKYWTGAANVFAENPLLGTGWSNFGPYYLAGRLPESPEEIRDPHNFIVRVFAELGIVGGLLLLAWLLRVWWEMTRPVVPEPPPGGASRYHAMPTVAAIATLAVAINALAAVDWTYGPYHVFLELLQRLLYLLVLLIGLAVVALERAERLELDERPAPWILYGLIVGIGMFFLHNLIDFAMWETGPLMLFALLIGAAVGARLPATEERPKRRSLATVPLAAGVAGWLVLAVFVVLPIGQAEALAQRGNELIRARRIQEGADHLRAAFARNPINADYARRAAAAMGMAGAPPEQIQAMLGNALQADPMAVGPRLQIAALEMAKPEDRRNPSIVRQNYEQALAIDPYNVTIRLQYAADLEQLGLPGQAAEQYEQALYYNDLFPAHELKRLRPERVEQVRREIKRLRGRAG